jgi:hypothetical protein
MLNNIYFYDLCDPLRLRSGRITRRNASVRPVTWRARASVAWRIRMASYFAVKCDRICTDLAVSCTGKMYQADSDSG